MAIINELIFEHVGVTAEKQGSFNFFTLSKKAYSLMPTLEIKAGDLEMTLVKENYLIKTQTKDKYFCQIAEKESLVEDWVVGTALLQEYYLMIDADID